MNLGETTYYCNLDKIIPSLFYIKVFFLKSLLSINNLTFAYANFYK